MSLPVRTLSRSPRWTTAAAAVTAAAALVLACRGSRYAYQALPAPAPPPPASASATSFAPDPEALAIGQLPLPGPFDLAFQRLRTVPPVAPIYRAGATGLVPSEWGRGWLAPRLSLALRPPANGKPAALETPFGVFTATAGGDPVFTRPGSSLRFYQSGRHLSAGIGAATWTFTTADASRCARAICTYWLSKLSSGVEKIVFEWAGDGLRTITGLLHDTKVERISLLRRPAQLPWPTGAGQRSTTLVREVQLEAWDYRARRWSATRRFVLEHDGADQLRSVAVTTGASPARTWTFEHHPAQVLVERDAHVPFARLTRAAGEEWATLLFGRDYHVLDHDGDGLLDVHRVDRWLLSSGDGYASQAPAAPGASRCAPERPHTLLAVPGLGSGGAVRVYASQADLLQLRLSFCAATFATELARQTLPIPAATPLGGWRSSLGASAPAEPLFAEMFAADADADGAPDLVLVTTDGFIAAPLTGNAAAPVGAFGRASVGPLRDGAPHQLVDLNSDGLVDFVEARPDEGVVQVWPGTRTPLLFEAPQRIAIPRSADRRCRDSFLEWSPFHLHPELLRICRSPALELSLQIFGFEPGRGFVKELAGKRGAAVLLAGGLHERGPAGALTWVAFTPRTPDARGQCPDGSAAQPVEPRCPPTYAGAVELSGPDEKSGLLRELDDGAGGKMQLGYEWSRRERGRAVSRPLPAGYAIWVGNVPAEQNKLCYSGARESGVDLGRSYETVVHLQGTNGQPLGTCEEPAYRHVSQRRTFTFDLAEGEPPRLARELRSGIDPGIVDQTDLVWERRPGAPTRLGSVAQKRVFTPSGQRHERVGVVRRYRYAADNPTERADTIEEERDGDVLVMTRRGDTLAISGTHRDPTRDFAFRLVTKKTKYREELWLEEAGRRVKLEERTWDKRGRITMQRRAGRPATRFGYAGDERFPRTMADEAGAVRLAWDPTWDHVARVERPAGPGGSAAVASLARLSPTASRITVEGEGDRLEIEATTQDDPAAGLLAWTAITRSPAGRLGASRLLATADGTSMIALDGSCSAGGAIDCFVGSLGVDRPSLTTSIGKPTADERVGAQPTWREVWQLARRGTAQIRDGTVKTGTLRVGDSTVRMETRLLLGDGNTTKTWGLRGGAFQYERVDSGGGLRSTWKAVDGASLEVERDALGRIVKLVLGGRETRRYRHDALGIAEVRVERPAAEGPPIAIARAIDPVTARTREHRVTAGDVSLVTEHAYNRDGRLEALTSRSTMGEAVAYAFTYGAAGSAAQGLVEHIAGEGTHQRLEYDGLRRLARRTTTVRLAGGDAILREAFGYFADGRIRSHTIDAQHPGGRAEQVSLAYELDGRGEVAALVVNGRERVTVTRSTGKLQLEAGARRLALAWLADERLQQATLTDGAQTAASYAMKLDRDTGLVAEERSTLGGQALDRAYAYTAGDQLRSVTAGPGAPATVYELSRSGRLVARHPGGGAPARIARSAGAIEAGAHRWTLNGLGVPTSIDGAPTRLDARGRITGDGKGGTYRYDATDQLVAIDRGSAYWVRAGAAQLSERGLRLAVSLGARRVGSVTGAGLELELLDGRGTRAGLATADPFGAGAPAAPGDEVLGGRAVPSLGMIQLGVRPYDPVFGQFAAPDLWLLERPEQCARDPRGCDLFAYTGGDPVNHVDPRGTRRIRVEVTLLRCNEIDDRVSCRIERIDTWVDLPDFDRAMCGAYGGCADPIDVIDPGAIFGPHPGYLPGSTPANAKPTDRAGFYERAGRDLGILATIATLPAIPTAGASSVRLPALGSSPEVAVATLEKLEVLADEAVATVAELFPELTSNPKLFGSFVHMELNMSVRFAQMRGAISGALRWTRHGAKGVDYWLPSGVSFDLMTLSAREFGRHAAKYVGQVAADGTTMIRSLWPIYYVRP